MKPTEKTKEFKPKVTSSIDIYSGHVLFLCCVLFSAMAKSNDPVAHVVKKNDSITTIVNAYQIYLNQSTLAEVNPQLKEIVIKKNKELIINNKVKLSACSHTVKNGEWLVKIIRKYSYKHTYSLGLTDFTVRKNSFIKNPNLIRPGELISIPIFYININAGHLMPGQSCDKILEQNEQNFSIVKSSRNYPASDKKENLLKKEITDINSKYYIENSNQNTFTKNNKKIPLHKAKRKSWSSRKKYVSRRGNTFDLGQKIPSPLLVTKTLPRSKKFQRKGKQRPSPVAKRTQLSQFPPYVPLDAKPAHSKQLKGKATRTIIKGDKKTLIKAGKKATSRWGSTFDLEQKTPHSPLVTKTLPRSKKFQRKGKQRPFPSPVAKRTQLSQFPPYVPLDAKPAHSKQLKGKATRTIIKGDKKTLIKAGKKATSRWGSTFDLEQKTPHSPLVTKTLPRSKKFRRKGKQGSSPFPVAKRAQSSQLPPFVPLDAKPAHSKQLKGKTTRIAIKGDKKTLIKAGKKATSRWGSTFDLEQKTPHSPLVTKTLPRSKKFRRKGKQGSSPFPVAKRAQSSQLPPFVPLDAKPAHSKQLKGKTTRIAIKGDKKTLIKAGKKATSRRGNTFDLEQKTPHSPLVTKTLPRSKKFRRKGKQGSSPFPVAKRAQSSQLPPFVPLDAKPAHSKQLKGKTTRIAIKGDKKTLIKTGKKATSRRGNTFDLEQKTPHSPLVTKTLPRSKKFQRKGKQPKGRARRSARRKQTGFNHQRSRQKKTIIAKNDENNFIKNRPSKENLLEQEIRAKNLDYQKDEFDRGGIAKEESIEYEHLTKQLQYQVKDNKSLDLENKNLIIKNQKLAEKIQKLTNDNNDLAKKTSTIDKTNRTLASVQKELAINKRELNFGKPTPPNQVTLQLTGSFDSLHAKKGSNVIVSNFQQKFGINWKQFWEPQWNSFWGLNLSLKSYERNTFSNKAVYYRDFNQGELYAGTEYQWKRLSFIRLSLGLIESIYYQQKYEDIYHMEKDHSLTGKLKLSHEILHYKKLRGGVYGHMRYISKGISGFDGGFDYGPGVSLDYRMNNNSVRGSILYHQGSFRSKWFSFEHRWLDFTVEYSIDF